MRNLFLFLFIYKFIICFSFFVFFSNRIEEGVPVGRDPVSSIDSCDVSFLLSQSRNSRIHNGFAELDQSIRANDCLTSLPDMFNLFNEICRNINNSFNTLLDIPTNQ